MRSVRLTLVSLSLLGGCRSFEDFYGSYSATCPSSTDAEIRRQLHDVGGLLGARFGRSAKVTLDRPDELVIVIDLLLIAGAPPYGPNSSGQIILSRSTFMNDNMIGIVINGKHKKGDDLTRTLRNAIEAELTSSVCSQWTFDSRTSFFLGH